VASLLLREISAISIINRIDDENKKSKFPGVLEECGEEINSTFKFKTPSGVFLF